MKNIQKYLIYGLLISLPFERLLTFEFAGLTVKLSYIMAFALLVFSLFNIRTLLKTKPTSFEWALLIFWAISLATSFWSPNQSLSLILNLVILLSFLTFFVLRRYFKTLETEKIISFFVWLAVATSLFALWQFIGDSLGISQNLTGLANLYIKNIFGFPRVQSTFFEPSFFANFLLLPLLLSGYMAVRNRRALDYVKLLLIGTAFFLTLSRGAFIALTIAIAILIIHAVTLHRSKLMDLLRLILLLFVCLAISLSAIYLSTSNEGVQNYINQAGNSGDVISGEKSDEFNPSRGYTVRVALSNAVKHPFGVGTGTFGTLPEFESIREIAGNSRQTVNSIYPEILVETGFLGLAAFLAFICLLLKELLAQSKKKYLNAVILVAVTAILIQFLSFSTYYLIYIWTFLAFAASVPSHRHSEQTELE